MDSKLKKPTMLGKSMEGMVKETLRYSKFYEADLWSALVALEVQGGWGWSVLTQAPRAFTPFLFWMSGEDMLSWYV